MDFGDSDIFAAVRSFCESSSPTVKQSELENICCTDEFDDLDCSIEPFPLTPDHTKLNGTNAIKSFDLTEDDVLLNTVPKESPNNVVIGNGLENAVATDVNVPSKTGTKQTTTTLRRSKRNRGGSGSMQQTNADAVVEITENGILNVEPVQLLPPTNQQRRARRKFVAEIGARAPVIDSIDLITSPSLPLLNLPNTLISVDSDDETTPEQNENNELNLSFDSLNPVLSILVKWGGEIRKFQHRKFQKFADLIASIAEQEKQTPDHVFLNLGDHIISPGDTPHSLDFKDYQFISGRILSNKITENVTRKQKANEIEIKVQSDAWKKRLDMSLDRQDSFKILYIKCAEELGIPYTDLKLSFDGELLEVDKTPEDLEFEGGEVIDCRLKK